MELEVEVWARRMTGIATNGDEVTSMNRILIGRENYRQGIAHTRALQECFVLVGKAFEMAINTGVAIGVSNIDSIAKTVHIDGDARDIAIGNRIDELALSVLGLHINTSMKMEWARLTKVAGKYNIVVYRRAIVTLNVER